MAPCVLAVIMMLSGLIKLDKPPLKELEEARKAIAGAREKKAGSYSAGLYNDAERFFDSAMVCLKLENKKFFIARDYSAVREYAALSEGNARKAGGDAVSESLDLQRTLKSRLRYLQNLLESNQDVFDRLPLPEQTIIQNSRGRLLLSEAQSAYKDGKYLISSKKLDTAEKNIIGSFRKAGELLVEYFKNYPEWQSWIKNTIAFSEKNNTYVFIVDKMAREILVYHKGALTNHFPVEFGKNWIGDKRMKGDKSTPEGIYKVIGLKQQSRTSFYKALLLDYPNEDDIMRFRQDKKSGELPASVDIGGGIEIHGEGGRGSDWTDGCIALRNSHMDTLFRMAGEGTRVAIAGSVQPLEAIWKLSD